MTDDAKAVGLSPKEIAERLVECFEGEDEMRYECNAMMFGIDLAKAYLALSEKCEKMQAVVEAAKEMLEDLRVNPNSDYKLTKALVELERE